ncbi:GRAM domain-containing protein 2B isoform X2 [Silurus meridionalis]|uniref:GRAM domain-containing protein 2B isoform X2 n=1 Tax=Silurus meridionalis TaxID=175797 RepID=UPI001EEADF6D|nr:GRAM domain-containing protein 2B isoform X2 [Silurus meridionalis]
MEIPFSCADSVLRNKTDSIRPTCSVLPSQQNEHKLQCHNTENGRDENLRKIIKSNVPMSVDSQSEILERRGKPTLIRSRTFDPSLLSHGQSDTESKTERKKQQGCNMDAGIQIKYYHMMFQFPRTNTQYHKIFKDVSENELLKQSYTCALQKDILYQGRLFVSDNWICFHSKVFGKDTKIAIPVISVSEIKKTKTAILVPNALIIATAQERFVFVSFLSRDTTYKVLMSVCSHLDDKCLGSIAIHSSVDGNYTMLPSRLPMNFSADLSDLDGPVVQRRQETGYSSSSDSPDSPEYEKMPELKQKVYDSKRLRPSLLNILLMVYLLLICILVLSSCYMAFKIVSLEKTLNSLGNMAEFTYDGDEYNNIYSEDPSRIYSAVSNNLVKLEKIQRGLQKLLDTTK